MLRSSSRRPDCVDEARHRSPQGSSGATARPKAPTVVRVGPRVAVVRRVLALGRCVGHKEPGAGEHVRKVEDLHARQVCVVKATSAYARERLVKGVRCWCAREQGGEEKKREGAERERGRAGAERGREGWARRGGSMWGARSGRSGGGPARRGRRGGAGGGRRST